MSHTTLHIKNNQVESNSIYLRTISLLVFIFFFQNVIWSFGLNRNIPVLNLTDNSRKLIMYACAHVGVLYDFENNRQHILQGHVSTIFIWLIQIINYRWHSMAETSTTRSSWSLQVKSDFFSRWVLLYFIFCTLIHNFIFFSLLITRSAGCLRTWPIKHIISSVSWTPGAFVVVGLIC